MGLLCVNNINVANSSQLMEDRQTLEKNSFFQILPKDVFKCSWQAESNAIKLLYGAINSVA